MQIVNINQGPKVAYSLNGNVLTIGDLEIDLASRQKNYEVTIDISRTESGDIIEGIGYAYVANIIIPPRIYTVEAETQTVAGAFTQKTKTPKPFNPAKATIQLWAIGE